MKSMYCGYKLGNHFINANNDWLNLALIEFISLQMENMLIWRAAAAWRSAATAPLVWNPFLVFVKS